MVEYKISLEGKYAYFPHDNVIEIGGKYNNYNNLTDNELLTSVADSITHEFMHYLLYREFNLTVSILLDTIGHYFYANYNLMDKMRETYSNWVTWENYIKQHGIQAFYENCHLTEEDIFEATLLCGGI